MTRIIAELLSSRFCSNCVLFASSPSVYDSLTYASALVVVPSNWFFRAGLSMRLVRLKPQGRAPIGVGPPGPHWAPKFLEKNCGLRKLLDSTFAIRKLYIAASAPGRPICETFQCCTSHLSRSVCWLLTAAVKGLFPSYRG